MNETAKEAIKAGKAVLGIEFGPIAWKTSGKDCRGVTRAWQTMWKQNTVKS